MSFEKQNLRIIILVLALFLCNKFFVRPYVLENNLPQILQIFVLSFPNFCEAVIGSLFLTNAALYVNKTFVVAQKKIHPIYLYIIAILITGVYVLLQEFKIHNLGGANVFDTYDVLFSCLGLFVVLLYLLSKTPKQIE